MSLFGSKSKSSSQLKIPDWLDAQVKGMAGQADDRILNRGTMNIKDMVAGMNPALSSALSGMRGFAGGQGGSFVDMLTQIGMQGMGSFGQGLDWMSQAAGRGPSMNMGPNMGNVAGYANDPYMDQMIQAALRDPARALTEQQMPASRMAQAMSGNTGSTRGAIGDAVLQRGFDDRAADVSAMMRSNAWNQGLGVEANRTGQNAGLDQAFTNMLAGLGNMAQGAGVNAANIFGQANSMALGNLNAGMMAGMTERGIDQEFLNAGIHNFNQPMMDLLQYSGLINPMAAQYGKNVQKGSQSPGLGSVGLALGSMAMGMPPGMFGGGGAQSPIPSGSFNMAPAYQSIQGWSPF